MLAGEFEFGFAPSTGMRKIGFGCLMKPAQMRATAGHALLISSMRIFRRMGGNPLGPPSSLKLPLEPKRVRIARAVSG